MGEGENLVKKICSEKSAGKICRKKSGSVKRGDAM
jgi:hypothetical protein